MIPCQGVTVTISNLQRRKLSPKECSCLPNVTELKNWNWRLTPECPFKTLCHTACQVTAFGPRGGDLPTNMASSPTMLGKGGQPEREVALPSWLFQYVREFAEVNIWFCTLIHARTTKDRMGQGTMAQRPPLEREGEARSQQREERAWQASGCIFQGGM